jgi:hypothetical protein
VQQVLERSVGEAWPLTLSRPVGESAPTETAITVTGLKPDHFYNVVIIAVGHNNFQAGSRVIRLHTFSKDGRPQLGNGRLPSNFDPDEQHAHARADAYDEDGSPRNPAAGIEAATVSKDSLVPSPSISSSGVARRNTLTRKHSPSTASTDQSAKDVANKDSEESLQKLGEKFESIRKEIEEVQMQSAKDEKELKELMDALTEEKKLKKRILKEKEETTEKLRREMGSTDRNMRSAQQKKTQLEKRLKDKQNDWSRHNDDMAKWDKDMAQMRKRQEGFEKEKATLQEEADEQTRELCVDIEALKVSVAHEERELKEKGRELKDAEDQRKKLPGGEESEEWHEKDRQMKREFDFKMRDLNQRVNFMRRRARAQEEYEKVLHGQVATAQQSGLAFAYSQANSSGVEFDLPAQGQLKQRSRNSMSMTNVAGPSPVSSFSMVDRSFVPASSGFGVSRATTLPPGFAVAPMPDAPDFTDFVQEPLDDEAMRVLTGGAPLSPTATALLPAGMLDMIDDEPPSSASRPIRQSTIGTIGTIGSARTPDNDPQSPVSSGRSISLSSPHSSSQHLPFSQFPGESSERRSLRGEIATGSPSASHAQPGNRFNNLLPWLRHGGKSSDEPPALGSLKPSQSQSLPRSTDGSDGSQSRRRVSLSGTGSWGMFNRNSTGPELLESSPAASRGLHSRRLGRFTNGNGSAGFSERDPSSPRPISIASSDLPRPSTESGSLWPRPPQPSRLWSPEGGDPWSRNPSRRPSVHGSPSALKTTLADADDEILTAQDIDSRRPSVIGVIGSKPSSKTLTQRLNPAAPSFMFSFRSRDRESRDGKEKERTKDKALSREKKARESLTSASEVTDSPALDDSPSDPRKSRDAFSVDNQSISESHDSLSLDQAVSNTLSDPSVGLGLKDAESGFRKLLRKGSSSKFSLSSIRGVSGKKGPGSITNSDKNQSVDRSSFDIDVLGEDSSSNAAGPTISRSYDSATSSPNLGAAGPGKLGSKDSRVGWGRFSMKKKPGKERESMEADREDLVPATPSTVRDETKA